MLGPMRALLCLLALAAPAALPAQEWRQARDVEVRMSNFDFTPGTIQLRAGEPVRLRIVNVSPTPHSFAAGAFFGRARVRGRDARLVADGKIVVPANDVREVVLVPAPGRYRARSGNFITRLLGMSSEIVVQ
jgi:plastocyanin